MVACVGCGGDAQAGSHLNRHTVELHRAADQVVHAPGALVRRLGRGVRQQDGELVAAQAEQQVAGAQRRSQTFAEPAQQFVAGAVPEPVVDGLEAVEVEQDEGGPTSIAAEDVHLRRERADGWAGRSDGR